MNTATATSASERAALAFFATLPYPVAPAQTFAPHLPIHYHDGAGMELEGRPDALCTLPQTTTFIESKNGRLNCHRDKESSHRALQQEYTYHMHDARDKPYNFLTDHFYRNKPAFLHDNAWNQSLFKVLALQALHGWERYIVCFKNNPKASDAQRYAEAGLVYCTEASLTQMLTVIDFASHGLFYPFCLDAHRSGYTVTVNPTPNPEYVGLTQEQIVAANRAKYEAVVAAYQASEQSQDWF